jgi:hypothetical protein
VHDVLLDQGILQRVRSASPLVGFDGCSVNIVIFDSALLRCRFEE